MGILLPAALVGALLGGAERARVTRGSNGWRWAILAPLPLAIAPAIVTENFLVILMTTGMGGWAIGVALIGVLGGYAVAGRGPWWTRVVSGSLASVLLLGIAGLFFGDLQSPLSAAAKAFGGIYGLLLMVLLIAGSSIPYRRQVDPQLWLRPQAQCLSSRRFLKEQPKWRQLPLSLTIPASRPDRLCCFYWRRCWR